jgi:chromosomal replication initiator protein
MQTGAHKPARSNLERTWNLVVERLREHPGTGDATRLARSLRPVALTPAAIRLEAPDRVTLLNVTDRYLPVLRAAVEAAVGPRQVILDLSPRGQGELFPQLGRTRVDRGALAARMLLNPRATFSTFVVGASNQFAHAAARAVAGQPGEHYNPLFIYAGVGLGKTHLVTAIGHQVLEQRPAARVAYLSCETFMNDLISSLRRDRMEQFKERYRRIDLLIVDDVHVLAGRERTQEEFFHTFNALHEGHRQIVLTSDRVPKDIPNLEERLRNRFEWGLIADMQPPDLETRIAIVERKAEIDGIHLPEEVAVFLAEHFSSNVRELEGSLIRLGAHASISHRPLTVDYAREVLETVLSSRSPHVSFEDIATAVCDHFSLRQPEMRSRRRSKHVVLPRQVAMYLCREHLGASFPEIARWFERDHSTVIHAIAVTRRRLKEDAGLQVTVDRLRRTLRSA